MTVKELIKLLQEMADDYGEYTEVFIEAPFCENKEPEISTNKNGDIVLW